MTIFLAASVVTLVAGVVLEQSGDRLADLMGINGVLFGATVLALASALPEISTAVTGVKMKTYTLVFGDIFGGNAFQLILFVLAALLAGQPVLPHEGRANAWIGMIGLVMTAVYVAGILLANPGATGGSARIRGPFLHGVALPISSMATTFTYTNGAAYFTDWPDTIRLVLLRLKLRGTHVIFEADYDDGVSTRTEVLNSGETTAKPPLYLTVCAYSAGDEIDMAAIGYLPQGAAVELRSLATFGLGDPVRASRRAAQRSSNTCSATAASRTRWWAKALTWSCNG